MVCQLTATREWTLEGVLWQGRLYLDVPSMIVQQGSKEGFIAVLEYAQEELQASHVILSIDKERPDRASVVRTFLFMGFSVLPPGHELIPANAHQLFMATTLD